MMCFSLYKSRKVYKFFEKILLREEKLKFYRFVQHVPIIFPSRNVENGGIVTIGQKIKI